MISVIIPLYNKEPIIERTLKSVLTQDYDDFEVIVVNDGSTDKSADIVKSINDPRIRLIEQENGGPSKARNIGVINAKGEWIVFLDADDEFLPGALKHFDELIRKELNVSFICCSYNVQENNVCKQQFYYHSGYVKHNFKSHFYREFLPHTGCAIMKTHVVLNNPFEEKIRRYEDYEQWFRIYRKTKIYLDPQIVLQVNVGYANASKCRKSVKDDFVGCMDFKNKCFWERMCLYSLYISERNHYSNEIDKIYGRLRYRYDILLLYKLLKLLKRNK